MPKLTVKTKALAAYGAALNDPSADWRNIAGLLYGCLRPQKSRIENAWADYPVECPGRKIVWPSSVIQVDFADGERVRMSFACLPGKPVNIGRGLRVAIAAYEMRVAPDGQHAKAELSAVTVPPVVACHVERDDEIVAVYPADEVNARIGSGVAPHARSRQAA